MKYMILMYASQQDYDAMSGKTTEQAVWPADELAALGAFMERFNQELTDAGELVDTRALAAPADAKRIQRRNGTALVADAPYPDKEEVLAAYWIVECASLDRAAEIATRLTSIPDPRQAHQGSAVDVRSIVESRVELRASHSQV